MIKYRQCFVTLCVTGCSTAHFYGMTNYRIGQDYDHIDPQKRGREGYETTV